MVHKLMPSGVLVEARRIIEIELQRAGLSPVAINRTKNAILTGLCRQFGGQPLYWPMVDRETRNAAIRAAFKDGCDPAQLCREFAITKRTLERILSAAE